jgi:hypothetical protein
MVAKIGGRFWNFGLGNWEIETANKSIPKFPIPKSQN